MKIFVVIASVELMEKPEWLDEFREKFDEAFEYHITLKQPSYVEDHEVPELKAKLARLFSKPPASPLSLVFDRLSVSDSDPSDICVMIDATKNQNIHELQKNVVNMLAEHKNYYKPHYQEYEENFVPHITIGRDLDIEQYTEAKRYLTGDYACTGVVKHVKLIVVDNFGPHDAKLPHNQTIFPLF